MVGIIILNYNKFHLTIACLNSIQEQNDGIKVYVVDNGSKPENLQQLQEALGGYDGCTLLRNEENLGFAAGMNVGVRKAIQDGCEYIAFTNSDIIFKKNSITKLCQDLIEHEDYGIVGPRIQDAKGNEQHFNVWKREGLFAYFCLETILSVLLPRVLKKFYFMQVGDIYDKVKQSYSISGCIFMMRSIDIEKIGYLDEYTFLYSEEFILAEQMRDLNKKVIYDGKITMVHNHQGSTTQGSSFVEKHKIRSRLYYLKKYRKAPYIYRLCIYYMMLIVPLFLHKVNGKRIAFYRETKKFVR